MKSIKELVETIKMEASLHKGVLVKGGIGVGIFTTFVSGCFAGQIGMVSKDELALVNKELHDKQITIDVKQATIDNQIKAIDDYKSTIDELESKNEDLTSQLVANSIAPFKENVDFVTNTITSYYAMSEEDRAKIDDFLDNQYNQFSGLAKDEYRDLYEKKQKDRESSKEKIEQERIEAERKAAEEEAKIAAEKAEQERIAQEQARVAQEQQSQEVYQEDTQTQMVWKSQTGKKYHSIPNCGNMNPNKATQIPLSSAQSQGLGKCSNCW